VADDGVRTRTWQGRAGGISVAEDCEGIGADAVIAVIGRCRDEDGPVRYLTEFSDRKLFVCVRRRPSGLFEAPG
jgi:hypothetical protein